MKIREFREEDAEEVSDLVISALREVNSRDYPDEVIEMLAGGNSPEKILGKAEKRLVLVAEEDGEVVGTASLKRDGGVQSVFVRLDRAGEGIGSALMKRVEEEARERGVEELVVPASLTAVDFYRKLGFRKSGEKLAENKGVSFWIVVMKKKL